MKNKILTHEAENDRAEFNAHYDGGNCSCHLSPPCGSCTHPGNPRNQDADETCWTTPPPAPRRPKLSRAQKALALCQQYDAELKVIAALTIDIGEALDGCPNNRIAAFDGEIVPPTHLSAAFAPYVGEDDFGDPERKYRSEDEQAALLAPCPSCQAAYQYVKERRAAKQRLGIVKRTMRAIGRKKNA